MAIANHPQDACVIWTLSSVLYHGTWQKAGKSASESSSSAFPRNYSAFTD